MSNKMIRDLGITELYCAVEKGNIQLVTEYLQENPSDIHVQKKDDGWSCLICSAVFGFSEITQLLLQHGAKIEQKDTTQRTALFYACQYGHLNVVKILLQSGIYETKVN